MSRSLGLCGVWLIALVGAFGAASGELITVQGQQLSVQVDPASGEYAVLREGPAWRFGGSVGQAVSNAARRNGRDSLGAFSAVTFEWAAAGLMVGEIRAYVDRPVVRFILTCKSAQPRPPAAFPTVQPPAGLHLFSYENCNFAAPHFDGRSGGGSPWLMFDDAAHAAILSPAAHFMIADVHPAAADEPSASTHPVATQSAFEVDSHPRYTQGQIASGWVSPLRNLPEGFTQSTVLIFGDGINAAWTTWGRALTDLSGKTRPTNHADAGLTDFGYWTDNGAGYYYNYDPKLGYVGTLEALVAKMRMLGIPLGYLQLDSWWYRKSYTGADGVEGDPYKNKNLPRGAWNGYGGLLEYVADKALFRQGLAAFHSAIALPLVTHNRWVDLKSPYRDHYQISGVAAVDPRWWDDIADYLTSSGVMTYEQDWLDRIYQYSPAFQTMPTAADAFMDNMARATQSHGLTMQYCMGLPRHYLQGSKYDNLTTVRVSDDRYERSRWVPSLYVSSMAAALGEWPWVDTFFSRETPNLILANLTAGMVGVGDKVDDIDAANIRKVIRGDGVIVKPDTPILPTDQTYVNDATGRDAPMIAAAFTDHGSMRTAYVFTFPRDSKQMQIHFRPADLGVSGDAMVYDAIAGVGTEIKNGATFSSAFKDSRRSAAWAYYIVTPTTRSGITLLGDQERFVSLGRQRIDRVQETADGIEAHVLFAPHEPVVTLHGFAPATPRAMATAGGQVDPPRFDLRTHAFSVAVRPATDGGSVTVAIVTQ